MNRKLRVLTLTAFFGPGGTSGRILGMAQGLDRSRIDQRLCTLYARQPEIASYFGTTAPLFDELGYPYLTSAIFIPLPERYFPCAAALRTRSDCSRAPWRALRISCAPNRLTSSTRTWLHRPLLRVSPEQSPGGRSLQPTIT